MYKRVLITGANGSIGRALRAGLKGRYPVLRLSHRGDLGAGGPGEEINRANLESFDDVSVAMEGMDAVVHLGGRATEGDWDTVLSSNIVGTYNVFEAARCHGVQRIVYASSHHVTGYYPIARRVRPDDPPRPDSRYGVSKVFGEALGRFYADKFSIGVVCLRIGCFREEPDEPRMLMNWISPRDMVELTVRSLEAPGVHFETIYGISANERSVVDNPGAERIGYQPADNAENFAAQLLKGKPVPRGQRPDQVFQGGPYTALDFAGDIDKIK